MTTSKRQPPWNEAENRAVCALYFVMLDAANIGRRYNKAAMIRSAQQNPEYASPYGFAGNLSRRSKQSIEFKLMNCTAAHQQLDPSAETMHGHGYRALSNLQSGLKDAMQNAIDRRQFDSDVRAGCA